MIDFADVKVVIKEESKGRATVNIGPLPRGYGYTMGNALRRVMLSSIEGAAVTSISIEGVGHEYSAVEGMLEDVFTLILNIRGIDFKLHSDKPETITLNVSGIKEVRAGDISLSDNAEVANPDLVIAHLTSKKAKLNVKMVLEKGIGYVYADDEKRSEVGLVPVDANFSPIKRVGFKVNDARVGQKTDFNEIVLQLEYRESANVKQILLDSCRIVAEGYVRIIKALGESFENQEVLEQTLDEVENHVERPQKETKPKAKNGNGVDLKGVKIEEMNVSARVVRSLYDQGINTADMLSNYSEEDIRALKGMGSASIKELKDAMSKLGISFK
jgi:DNA-directed RNA polymerase subunit alpha